MWDSAGGLQLVARASQTEADASTAPGTSGILTGISHFRINDAGNIAYAGSARAGTSPLPHGVWTGTPGNVEAVTIGSLIGPSSAGTTELPGGGVIQVLLGLSLASNGEVAFHGQVSGGSSTEGIYAGTPGNVRQVTQIGATHPDLPDLPDGVTIAIGIGVSTPFYFGDNQVGFIGGLSGPGTSSGDRVLFGEDASGDLQILIQSGDTVEADGQTYFVRSLDAGRAYGNEEGEPGFPSKPKRLRL